LHHAAPLKQKGAKWVEAQALNKIISINEVKSKKKRARIDATGSP
jgi:hypothetical protein